MITKLIEEYRPTMPAEVLHLWAKDVIEVLKTSKVYVVTETYLEDYSHPFNDPDEITEVRKVFSNKADAEKLAEEIRAKKTKYRNRAEIHTRTLD